MSGKTTHRVLVTGSAGAIGQPVCRELLSRGHQVRGFDRRTLAELPDTHVGELTEASALCRACEGMDTIIHLAAAPTPMHDFLTEIMPSNIAGTYNLFEAARQTGTVRRVIFGSSLQVGARSWGKDQLVAPSNHYGLSKVYGELLGEMYSRLHHLEVVAARIGFLPRSQHFVDLLVERSAQNIYLSPADAGRFFAAAVEASLPEKFMVFYAIGKTDRPAYDLEPARRILGYEPCDTWPQGMQFPK